MLPSDKPEYNFYSLDDANKELDANTAALEIAKTNLVGSAGGTTMSGGDTKSMNYSKGASGWMLGSDGNAEFQNITARGTVTADTLNIGGITEITVTTADDLQTALNTINTAGGGTLRLSPGTYVLTNDLVVYDNTQIEGDSSGNTTLSFGSAAYGITYTGTDVYTTGTLSVNTGSTSVTGSGTTWTAAMIGRQIFISNRWYVISARSSDTSITLATAFADANVSGGTYRIANPINNVSIKHVTITASTTNAVEGLDIRDLVMFDVVLVANNVGMSLTNFMNILPEVVTAAASTSHGVVLTNGSFLNASSMASVSNGGSGVVTNNIKACTFIWSAANANTADGYNCTDTDSCQFKLECSGNGGQGIEFVSGCDSNFINDSLISGNTSDGIKLTATCDRNTIGGAVNVEDNGAYGINIAASTCDNNMILAVNYDNNTSGNLNDAGTGTNIIQQVSGTSLVPVATVSPYAGSSAPSGWLLCDGASLLRTSYADLFDVIGTTYGAVDGTHFNIPNLKGKVPVGYNSSETEFDSLGETGGAKTHTLTTSEMPSHTHTTSGGNSPNSGSIPFGQTQTGTNNTTGSEGGGGAHNNLQPYITLNYIIKT